MEMLRAAKPEPALLVVNHVSMFTTVTDKSWTRQQRSNDRIRIFLDLFTSLFLTTSGARFR